MARLTHRTAILASALAGVLMSAGAVSAHIDPDGVKPPYAGLNILTQPRVIREADTGSAMAGTIRIAQADAPAGQPALVQAPDRQ